MKKLLKFYICPESIMCLRKFTLRWKAPKFTIWLVQTFKDTDIKIMLYHIKGRVCEHWEPKFLKLIRFKLLPFLHHKWDTPGKHDLRRRWSWLLFHSGRVLLYWAYHCDPYQDSNTGLRKKNDKKTFMTKIKI